MTKGRPYSETRLAAYLQKRILELRPKTQRAIAVEAGFINANVLAMLKSGANKLPLDRVPALAQALDCDPRYLFLLALEQDMGATHRLAIEEIFGAIVTRNELAWLKEIREASGNSDPGVTSRARSAVRAIFQR
ncbi:XRE family transcriptional regulator [Halodurantibacterium flavum]|uniref:XRE family transcriptional regulator n=1 Tax=Halodurantibacterium flavum TaxID=1382802 RepID=A0ABW4S644_9RHOB